METSKLQKIIQYTCSALLIGRAIQHLFYDSPIRGALYSPLLMKPILQLFNISFNDYINYSLLDININTFLQIIGFTFFILGVSFLFLPSFSKKLQTTIIYFSVITLTILSFAYFKEKSFSIGQFLEYSSQMFLPLFFILKNKKTLFLKVIIGITFFAHGLYAIGYYPIPANFIQMVILVFHCSNQDAILLLKVAGILDFIFAIAIFIPALAKPFLFYGIIWGFFTSFARIYTNFYMDFAFTTLSFWFYEFIVRSPHYIIPYVIYKQLKSYPLKSLYSL